MESNRQEEDGGGHHHKMDDHLRPQTLEARKAIGVEVSREQHQLKEEDGGSPDRCRSSKKRQHHLRDHRLEAEKKECAEEERRLQEDSQLVRDQHAASLTACSTTDVRQALQTVQEECQPSLVEGRYRYSGLLRLR